MPTKHHLEVFMQRRLYSRRPGLAPLTLLAAATLALAGCAGSSGAPAPGSSADGGGDKPVAVTLITKDSVNPFWIAMQNGAKQAATSNNVKVTVAAGKEDGDEAGQVEAIEAAMTRGDQGILIAVNGPGVNTALNNARKQGLYVIALDTPPEPAETADITFATDNFAAGEAIGKWTAAQLRGKKATIALLDAFNDKVISVDYNRDQGFLTGMGIDTKDKTKNGDEDKSGTYTGGQGGDYQIVCNEPTKGAQDGGKAAMEACLSKSGDINVVYTLNEPGAAGAADALKAAGKTGVIITSVDGGCQGVENVQNGTIGATSQQYPLKMAQLGVEAIAKIARGGEKPAVTSGLDFYDTGVKLVTDKKVDGLDSIGTTEGLNLCWGDK
jgi:fructose transport system substrate-binding protein